MNDQFLECVTFSDERTSHLSGTVNIHSVSWGSENHVISVCNAFVSCITLSSHMHV